MSDPRVVCVLVVAVAACGGGGQQRGAQEDDSGFECNDRRAEYMVVGGFVAAETGISMLCDGDRPVLRTWKVDTTGNRDEDSHPLSGAQFEATWDQIDSTGWRFLEKDCGNKKRKGEPIYTIDIADSATNVSLSCTGKELPFPYDRLVNELDLRAAGFGDDAGDPH